MFEANGIKLVKWLLAMVTALICSHSVAMPWADSGDLQKGIDQFAAAEYGPAVQKLRPFAEHGDMTAQFFLGVAYTWGYGVDADYAQATSWFRKAADQVTAADTDMAHMLHDQLLVLGEKRFADPAADIHYFLLRMDPVPPVCTPGNEGPGTASCADRQKFYEAIKVHLTPEAKAYRDFEVAFFARWLKPGATAQ